MKLFKQNVVLTCVRKDEVILKSAVLVFAKTK